MNDINYHKISRLLAVTGCPEYVKVGSAQVDCPNTGYADPVTRQYPCNTKEATFLSFLTGLDHGADAYALTQIRKFAHFWGIEQDLDSAEAKLADSKTDVEVKDLTDEDFALVQKHGSETVRKYAAVDSETTVDAAVAFYDNRTRYPLEWRKQAATNLLNRAEQFGANLPVYVSEYLHKAAGFAVATPEAIDDAIVARLNLTPLSEHESIAKMAQVLNAIAEDDALRFDQNFVGETLRAMDSYDREIKLAQHYASGRIPLPEEILTLTETQLSKYAGCSDRIVRLVNGHEVDVGDLSSDALDAVDEKLASMSLAKLADVLPTLPKPEADLLITLLPAGKSWKTAGETEPGIESSPIKTPAPVVAAEPTGTPAAATPAPTQSASISSPAIAPQSQPAAIQAGNQLQPNESADAYFDRISAVPAAAANTAVTPSPVTAAPMHNPVSIPNPAASAGATLSDTAASRLQQARTGNVVRGK